MSSLRERTRVIIFHANTTAGKAFDVGVFIAIGISIFAIMLESVPSFNNHPVWQRWFSNVEWVITMLFTAEYLLRLWSSKNAWRYAKSFYGVIDLLAILPFFLTLILPAASTGLGIIRVLRLLRIFRVLKLTRFLVEGNNLWLSILRSGRKIAVFLFTVVLLCILLGSIMYTVEGGESGFTSIPRSIYWAIVTLTTVGYGDIAPQTVLGQMIASTIMILGYAIIAVPTGIITVDLATKGAAPSNSTDLSCQECNEPVSETQNFCPNCGTSLDE